MKGLAAIAEQELRDLWIGGRALLLSLAFSLLLSVLSYLVATNTALNYLEQRESVNLTLQVAIAIGALLALLVGADTISGERERGTLETLLLTPVSRTGITTGKLLGALSLWIAAFAIAIPYVWFLGRGIGIVGVALAAGLLVGTLLAFFLASLGVVVRALAASNRISLSVSLFLLPALYAPTQFPASAPQGSGGESLPAPRAVWADPVPDSGTAGLGRRALAANQPHSCGRALRRQARDRRALLGPGCVVADLAGHRGRRLWGDVGR